MKCFYTSPLSAIWMTKHFGMNFYSGADIHLGYDSDAACLSPQKASELIDKNNEDYKAYIHPDSLPILEPKNGDLVAHYDFSGSWKNPYYLETTAFDKFGLNIYEYFLNNGGMILQRKGIAFMWPESEG